MGRPKKQEKKKESTPENEFEIEQLAGKRGEGRTLQYMVKWRGYPDTDNTWESAKDLPKNLIKKFADQVKLKEAAGDDDSSEEEIQAPAVVPKKRGRPKSQLKKAEAAADEDSDEDAAPAVTPKRGRGRPKSTGSAKKATTPKRKSPVKRGRPKKYPVSESEEEEEEEVVPAKRTSKPAPKKTTAGRPKKTPVKVEVVRREIVDNIVHYQLKGQKSMTPIYEFDDFEPIFEFELLQTQKDENALSPVRVMERKGKKYNIEFANDKGRKSNSWVDRTALACIPLMNEFDDRDDDSENESDVEYSVKKIIGKRKNGRVYEYNVIWTGHDAETATWEPEENLTNAQDKIDNFERTETKKQAELKAKKRKNSKLRKAAKEAIEA